MYDAWLLDLDGTLYRARPVKAAMAVEMLVAGPRAVRIVRRFRKEHERLRQLQAGSDSAPSDNPFRLQIERTAEALDLPVAEVEHTVVRWMVKRPGRWLRRFRREALIQEIREFRALRGKTAIVSDYPAEDKLRALGVRELFDIVVASGDSESPPYLKPRPEGLLRAAELLGVVPERCLMLGDRPDADGLAAQQAEMAFRLV